MLRTILESAYGSSSRPAVNDKLASKINGLYIAGDLAGAPVVKLSMEQGYQLALEILAQPDARGADPEV